MAAQILIVTLQLAALLLLYWASDVVIRREGWPKLLGRVGITHRGSTFLLAALVLPAAWFFSWPGTTDERTAFALFASVHGTLMAWKGGTDDIDVARGQAWWLERGVMLLCAIGVWWSPAFIPLHLHVVTRPFFGWKHHGSLPLRVLQLSFAQALFLGAVDGIPQLGIWSAELGDQGLSVFLVALLMMHGSHYLPTAVAKGILGPQWYSWMLDNRLYYVAASSYTWGWARFLPRPVYSAFLRLLRLGNRPMQIGAWIIEATSPILLLHPFFAIAWCFATGFFHVVVFISTGIFFWEWTVTNLLIVNLLLQMNPETLAVAFGPLPWLLSVIVMVLLPFRGKLWDPNPLGWWDTPLCQRVTWRIVGESGTVYDLTNDFMCPHERTYGRVQGCFMIQGPVFTYHLGEVWIRELRDEIWALRDHPENIEALREKWGISIYEPEMAEKHVRYLKKFLQELNRGARKFVFPKPLRFLKAAGGQFYYWGERPRFRGQEKALRVEVWFHEEWWDGEVHHRFQDRMLCSFEVEDERIEEPCEELDERVVDAMILQRANGTLCHAPEWLIDRARELYDPGPTASETDRPSSSADSEGSVRSA